jgi:hypothetical protein
LLIALAACTGDDGNGSAEDCTGPMEATLQDPGAEPHQVLELTPTVGDQRELELRTAVETEFLVDDEESNFVDSPDMRFGMVITVEEVSDDEIIMSFEYDDVAATTTSHVAMVDAVEAVAGVTGTFTTTRAGGFIDVEIADRTELEEAAAGHEVSLVLGGLEWMLTDMAVPFPDEAVGAGAQWTTAYPSEDNTFPACIETRYTLTALDDESYEVSVEWAEDAIPTTVENSDGTSVETVAGSTSGSIHSSGTLEFPLPLASSVEVNSEFVEEIDYDGEAEKREINTLYQRGFEPRH